MSEQRDTLAEWEFAISCLRAEVVAGHKLTPAEMVKAVDAAGGPVTAPERMAAE